MSRLRFAGVEFFSAVMSFGFAVTLFYVDVYLVVAVTPVGHRNLLSILDC